MRSSVRSYVELALWRRVDDIPEDAVPWAIGIARLQLANAQRARRRQDRLAARVAVLDPPPVVTPPQDADELGEDVPATLVALRRPDAGLLGTVAAKLGYASASAFSRTFARRLGQSPRA